MRGILRSTMVLYGGSVQVWVLASAAVLLAASTSLAIVFPTRPNFPATLLQLMAIMVAMSGLFLGGVNFRAAAAARAVRFIPRARMQLALGVLLGESVIAALVTTQSAMTHLPPATTFLQAFLMIHFWVLWSFLVAGPNPWLRWSMVSLPFLVGLALMTQEVPKIPDILHWQIIVASTCTILFGVWYLRARSIAPPSLEEMSSLRITALDGRLQHPTARTAINLQLLRQASAWRACLPLMAIFGCMVLAFVRMIPGSADSQLTNTALMSLTFDMVGALSGVLPSQISRRARPLWLSGLSRAEVFAQVERVSWECLAITTVPLLTLIVLLWSPLGSESGRYLFLLTLSTACCSVYLAIMNVHGASPLNFPWIVFLIISLAVLPTQVPQTPSFRRWRSSLCRS